ncbi:MAG: DUF1634 domain-containing protein [Acidobacteriota bacterium]|nr:DUF1634 domain-containing protein [Acidobacteriota bacterium]
MTDQSIERSVSVLLATGVIIAGSVTLVGGALFLSHHWRDTVDYRAFHGEPSIDRLIPEIVVGAFKLRGRSVIQFGMLLLIATPVARVALALYGFASERDREFVVITALVLAILLYSLISGAVGG